MKRDSAEGADLLGSSALALPVKGIYIALYFWGIAIIQTWRLNVFRETDSEGVDLLGSSTLATDSS